MRGFKEENNNSDLATVPNNTDQDVKKKEPFHRLWLFSGSLHKFDLLASGDCVTSVWTLQEGETIFALFWKTKLNPTLFLDGVLSLGALFSFDLAVCETAALTRGCEAGQLSVQVFVGAVWFGWQGLTWDPPKSSKL